MAEGSIQASIAAARAYLTEHPAEARYTDSLATATLGGGLVVDVTGPAGEQVTTDMSRSVGGTASAPSPGWLLRAAEASCVATLIAMRAASLGITLETLVVSVDSESDDRGILDLDPAVPAGPLSGRLAIRLTAPGVDPRLLEEMAHWGVKHCPVCDALERSIPITVEVTTD